MRLYVERDDLPAVLLYDSAAGINQTYALLAHDGLGTPPVERVRMRGYRQDGETDLGGVLRPRRFALTILIQERDGVSLEQARAQLFSWLRPDAECRLVFVRDGREMVLSAALIDAIAAPSAETWGAAQRVSLQMEASDPLFRARTAAQISFTGAGSSGMAVPILVPIGIGDGAASGSEVIDAGAIYYTPVVIEIVGPCTSATVTVNGRALSISSVQAERRVVIDTRWGVMSATEYEGEVVIGSRFRDLSGALDLRMSPGTNEVNVSMMNGAASSAVILRWTPAYLSL